MIASTYLRDYFPVTGRSTTQKAFDRLPVQELEANHPHQWTLFILAWAYIKDAPIPFACVVQPPLRATTSLMEIGGIHGKPYREWSGDRRTPEEAQVDFSYHDKKDMFPSPSRFGGYCHHAAVTFPSWHRPYIMLIEQAIGEYAENIAQQIENAHPGEVGRWVRAAEQLRFPYWDWADPNVDMEGLPSLFCDEELSIMGLDQKYLIVQNPLVCFTFPYIPYDFEDNTTNGITAYFGKWQTTYRHADNTPNPAGSNTQALQSTLKERAESVRTSVGMLFTFRDEGDSAAIYDEFSNTLNQSRQDTDYNNTGSLESVHNSIHGNLGGNGHMGYVDYAAFDPLFYFHHCNIDRLIALWEWCYPDYWMSDGFTIDGAEQKWTLKQGTYSAAYSQVVEEDGEWGMLVPWRHPDGTYWTSKETRFLTSDSYPKCGVFDYVRVSFQIDVPLADYSYKEFLGVRVDSAATSLKERQQARARIAKYYNVDPGKFAQSVHLPSWTHIDVSNTCETGLSANYVPIKNLRIFKVLVRLSEYAVSTSYQFDLCYKQELVGSITVFAREDSSPCKACKVRRTAGSIVRGVITIPSRIINDIIVHSAAFGGEGDNTMDAAVRFIAVALSARLVDLSGHVLASAQDGAAAAAVGPVPVELAAPKVFHPVEVALLSSAVAEHVEDETLPVHFFDFRRHMDLLPVCSSGAQATSGKFRDKLPWRTENLK